MESEYNEVTERLALYEKTNSELKTKVAEQEAIIVKLRSENSKVTFEPGKRRKPDHNNTFDLGNLTGVASSLSPFEEKLLADMANLTSLIVNQANRISTLESVIEKLTNSLSSKDGVRARSESTFKSTGPKQSTQGQRNPVIKATFAEIIAGSPVNVGNIRHVHLNCEETDCGKLLNQIQRDNSCSKEQITNIQQKGPCDFSVTCANDTSAQNLERAFVNKYQDGVTISTPKAVIPQVKIARLMTGTIDGQEILEQLKEQNAWLTNLNITVDRVYRIDTGIVEYTNIILNTDIASQRALLDVGSVIFGIKQSRIFECVDVKQCKRCQGLGHLSRSCKNEIKCRKCAGDHDSGACTSDITQCVNCLSYNEKNTEKLNTQHRASDDRCKCRQVKIHKVKNVFMAKNQKIANLIAFSTADNAKNVKK